MHCKTRIKLNYIILWLVKMTLSPYSYEEFSAFFKYILMNFKQIDSNIKYVSLFLWFCILKNPISIINSGYIKICRLYVLMYTMNSSAFTIFLIHCQTPLMIKEHTFLLKIENASNDIMFKTRRSIQMFLHHHPEIQKTVSNCHPWRVS